MAASLHFKAEDHYIGDVHPYFDEKEGVWYIFYLIPGGTFASKLFVSKDGIHFIPREIYLKNEEAPYAVLVIERYQDMYFTYYGQGHHHACSKSFDLVHWENDTDYHISVLPEQFPLGQRDPSLFYSKENQTFYCVSLAYFDKAYRCALALYQSKDLKHWNQEAKIIRCFHNEGLHFDGEPECPQIVSIDNCLFLLYSLARKTVHHVGGTSYLCLKTNDMEKVKWDQLEEKALTSEDLCAAQIGKRADTCYLFGWIPQGATIDAWGGHLNFPLIIYREDETLCSKIDPVFYEKIKGRKEDLNGDIHRHIFEISASITETFTIDIAQEWIHHLVFDCDSGAIQLYYVGVLLSEIKIPKEEFIHAEIRLIVEEDILELYINDKYTLHARLKEKITAGELSFSSSHYIEKIEKFGLKTIEEMEEK